MIESTEPIRSPFEVTLVVDGRAVAVALAAGDTAAATALADRLARAGSLPIVLLGDDADTEGHRFDDEAWAEAILGDDVEGHAVRLRFASREDAQAVRDALSALGRRLEGSLAPAPGPSRVAMRDGALRNPPRAVHRG